MWYFLTYGVLAIWVLIDTNARRANTFGWTIGTLLLGPIVLPFYLAKRPLKGGETREGGTAWNVLKTFALLWTLLMVIMAIAGLIAAIGSTSAGNSTASAIGTAIGLGFIGAVWFLPFVGALGLGLFLRKSSVVERGPTGPLAPPAETNEGVAASPRRGTSKIGMVVSVVAIAAVGYLTLRGLSYNPSAISTTRESAGSALSVVDWDWGYGQYNSKYIRGTVTNPSGKEYSYVSVEFNLYDDAGAQVGTAMDNITNLEAYGTWKFEAIVLEDRATKARLKEVTGW